MVRQTAESMASFNTNYKQHSRNHYDEVASALLLYKISRKREKECREI